MNETTQMAQPTYDQIRTLLRAHCHRVVNNMDQDDLVDYAIQMMQDSFDINPGSGDTNVYQLMTDIQIAENGDEDAMFEFVHGEIDDADVAQELINMTA